MLQYSIMALKEVISEEETIIQHNKKKKGEAVQVIIAEAEMIIQDYELAINILEQIGGEDDKD